MFKNITYKYEVLNEFWSRCERENPTWLKPKYSFGKWWKWKISLMGIVHKSSTSSQSPVNLLFETINFRRKLHKTNIIGMPPRILP